MRYIEPIGKKYPSKAQPRMKMNEKEMERVILLKFKVGLRRCAVLSPLRVCSGCNEPDLDSPVADLLYMQIVHRR